jgi:hypothetical protein
MTSARQSRPQSILRKLPETLEYTGEFGAELVLFTPFCEWLSSRGLLRNRSLRIYAGMRCFYDQMKCRAIIEKDEDRRYVAPAKRPDWMPIRNEHTFDTAISNRFLRYPDLRARFSSCAVPHEIAHSTKPLLVVHNKYNIEWDRGPINCIPLRALDKLFGELKSRYTVVYVRHGATVAPGYSRDHNTPLMLDETKVLRRHPTVLNFDDLYRRGSLCGQASDFNTFKNAIYSRCYHFISSQGGGAHHIALYSGSLIAILHKEGRELEWAYSSGYYGFMADPPPIRVICRHEHELDHLAPIFATSRVVAGRVVVSDANEPQQRLSSKRQQPQASHDYQSLSTSVYPNPI